MVVVKSFDASDLDVDNTANAGPKLLKSYLEYAEAVSADDLPGAEAVLDSISSPHGESPKTSAEFMDRLCAELVSRGYEAERDVGIGSCILDVAVRKDGRYVIGIEDDRRIYAAGGTVRERDYHRERFLANRGWRTVRTWTPAVQRHPDGEMERILSEVEKACGNLSG